VKEIKTDRITVAAILLATAIIAALLVVPGLRRRGQRGYATLMALTTTAEAAETDLWNQAVQKVKEDRGEPTGRQAKVDIPSELSHYSDSRRFLAIQVAEWREHRFETPHDFVDLARQISTGELVELKRVSDTYVLFGVGGNADREPFTYYDKNSARRIALYGEAELKAEYTRLAENGAGIEDEINALKKEFDTVGRGARSRRVKLQARIAEREKALKAVKENKELLDDYYGDGERRRQLLADYEALANLAAHLSGRSYNISDPAARQEMKIRMLSFLRPEALKVMEEIADAYHQKFERPLPVTSLVRPDEYQQMLHKVNPNATLIDTPPHSTGLAFDINYKYMTAEEQSYVMDYLAGLEDQGRIEVLRENRDHYHVFAFIDGARPSESLISQSLGQAARAKTSAEAGERVSRKEEKRAERKAAHADKRAAHKESKKEKKQERKGRRR
jgi:hypothetical protein